MRKPQKLARKTAAQVLEDLRDPRHNPEKALDLIKAAHWSGGRPAAPDHVASCREAWVQRLEPGEVIVKRNGKIGYRAVGAATGPLRRDSCLDRRLRDYEKAFLGQIAQYTKLDSAIRHLTAVRPRATRRAVEQRKVRAKEIEALVIELYNLSGLPTHSRAAAIARQLKVKGCVLSDRRIRQIIQANFPSRVQKNGNDRD